MEADDTVVAEGSVRAPKRDGTNEKIRRLISYLMEVK